MQVKELGHLVLYVRDLERSSAFYRDVLGWRQILPAPEDRSGLPIAAFSAPSDRTHHELLLIEVGADAAAQPEGRRVGPLPLRPEGRRQRRRAARGAARRSRRQALRSSAASDHTVTHSLYIADPDGNEIELYIDVPGVDWRTTRRSSVLPSSRSASDARMDDEDVRLAVYRSFAATGAAPSDRELADSFGAALGEVHAALTRLHDARHIVLADGAVVMAHPFAAIPLGFSVMGESTLSGGAAVPGTRSPSRTWSRRRPRSSSRRPVRAATLPSPGWWTATPHRPGRRSRTSSLRRRGSGTTSCAAAATSDSSAAGTAWLRGWSGRPTRRATSWISRPCGGSPGAGTPGGWTVAISAGSHPHQRPTSGRLASPDPSGG